MLPAQAPEIRPFVGVIETTVDAVHIALAARLGLIPRIQRRLNDEERATMLKSGAVFCFGVEESNIRRWTDGLAWSPSRISGNFLVYREAMVVEPTTGKDSNQPASGSPERASGDRTRSEGTLGPLKEHGLWKKTISLAVEGVVYHVVSYFTEEDLVRGRLPRPTSRADLMQLVITPDLIRPSDFRTPPPIRIGRDGKPFVFDAEEGGTAAPGIDGSNSSVIRRSRRGPASTAGPPGATAAPQDLKTFMHRWAIPPPGVGDPHNSLMSPAYHTLSFPQSSPTATQQLLAATPSSNRAHYGDGVLIYQDDSYHVEGQAENDEATTS